MSNRASLRTFCVCMTTLCATALTACGSGPSDAAIEKALKDNAAQGQPSAKDLAPGARGLITEIHSVKNLGCKSVSDAVYACDVEVDVSQFGKRAKGVTNVRMAKGSDGWTLAQ